MDAFSCVICGGGSRAADSTRTRTRAEMPFAETMQREVGACVSGISLPVDVCKVVVVNHDRDVVAVSTRNPRLVLDESVHCVDIEPKHHELSDEAHCISDASISEVPGAFGTDTGNTGEITELRDVYAVES